MKNLMKKAMLFAAAAMAFVSCQNDATNDENVNVPGFEVSVNATTSEVVRSAFGDYNSTDKTYPTLWEGNEAWWIGVNNKTKENVNTITFSNGNTAANAKFEFTEAPTAAGDGTYTLYALSPASACSSYKLEDDYLRFYIARNNQTPTATSCDPASQVLLAKSEAMESADAFTVNFSHLSAYIKFSFVNVAEGGVVSSVTIAAEDVNLAGRYEYTLSTGELAEKDQMSKDITLVTESHENLWVSVAPVDLSGKTLTFTLTTDKGILSKEVTMPATAKLESGKVVTFNVDMAGIEYPSAEEGEEWYLVTNTADLTDGEYIIVGKSQAGNVVYLPNTTTSSAPSQKVISVPGLDLTSTASFKTLLIPEDARFTFTGSASSMIIKNADGKYLYAFDDNNGLRIGTTSGTWVFAKNSNNANSLTLKFSDPSRYVSVYKSQDWRSYTSVKPDQHDGNGASGSTFIYKKVSTDPFISSDAISVAATGGEGESSYSCVNMGETDDVTFDSASKWISAVAGDGLILYEVEPNYTGKARTGEIVLKSTEFGITKTIPVTQAADEFSVSTTSVSLKADENSTATFTVTSTYAATITVSDSAKWSINPTTVTGGASAVTITVTAKTANTTADAVIGKITVTRSGDDKALEVTASQDGVQQGGGETKEIEVTHDFTAISDFSSWGNSYTTHTVEYDEATVTFSSANKQSQTITNMPVTKGQPVTLVAKNGATIKNATFVCKKWSSNAQTITLHYSTDGGNTFTALSGTSTTFTISKNDLPAGTNAVKITFNNTSKQVGIESATITYVTGGSAGGDDSGNTGGGTTEPDPTPDPTPDPGTGGDDSGNTEVTETLSIAATTGVMNGTTSISWDSTNFTVVNEKGSSTTAIRTSDSDHYRVYANSTLKFVAKNNKKISKLVITVPESKYAEPLKNTLGSGATFSGTTVTWTGSAAEISGKVTAQTRISKVVATLQ